MSDSSCPRTARYESATRPNNGARAKPFVFDDTVTHEAWNYGTSDRVVLLFDFVRPGSEHMPQDELPASVAGFVRRGG
ncbi:aspartyl/asparaginyl beta-hydroxylase domain-containing protein [Micromonospora sp. NPDC005220]|uniref:aspartyl/asparaginyl beta-hydroxylase domain-containing protein n=1 Tax=Micromonospora sp. NPDC005220 TaxID=3155589 RepID=UPI0033B5DECE